MEQEGDEPRARFAALGSRCSACLALGRNRGRANQRPGFLSGAPAEDLGILGLEEHRVQEELLELLAQAAWQLCDVAQLAPGSAVRHRDEAIVSLATPFPLPVLLQAENAEGTRGGQITGSGLGTPDPRKHLAVTGGTGTFTGARGSIRLVENGDGTGTLEIALR